MEITTRALPGGANRAEVPNYSSIQIHRIRCSPPYRCGINT